MKLRNKETGEKGYFCFANWNDPVLIIMDGNGVQLGKYNSLAELNEEWEDYEEPKEYWYIENNGDIDKETYEGDEYEEEMIEIGNYFETKEEAEKAVEKLKAWKRLKDKGFKFYGYNSDFEGYWVIYPNDTEGTWCLAQDKADLDLLFGGEE